MHPTKSFGWDHMFDLGRNYASSWQDYLDEFPVKNLTRDPPARR